MKTLLLDATANFASVPGSGSGAVDDIFVFTNFNQGNVLAFTALTCQGITTIRRHNRPSRAIRLTLPVWRDAHCNNRQCSNQLDTRASIGLPRSEGN